MAKGKAGKIAGGGGRLGANSNLARVTFGFAGRGELIIHVFDVFVKNGKIAGLGDSFVFGGRF